MQYHLLLSANICLLKSTDNNVDKVYSLSQIALTLTTRELDELMNNIRRRDLPIESLQYAALELVELRQNIYCFGEAYLSAIVSCEPAKISDMFVFYLDSFTTTAYDGYLAGDDAVVFRQGETEYSLVLDDIRAVVYENESKKMVKGLKMLNYWIPSAHSHSSE